MKLTEGKRINMKVAICDDDPNDIRIIKEFSEIHKNVSEIVEFTSPKPFLKRLYSGEHFDSVKNFV